MKITASFDSGNIEIANISGNQAHLTIRKDAHSDFYQWFHFRLSGVRGEAVTLVIENAGGAAYVDGWPGYQAVGSYDRRSWFRLPTDYDGERLIISVAPVQDALYIAYFAPFSMEQHADLVARACQSDRVTLRVLGQTLDGQDMDLLEIRDPASSPADLKTCWFIARQHPGETMAEWWMDGALARLLDPTDPTTTHLLRHARVFLVPNMNPDGSRRGHLRTNAAGVNLNRVWHEPSMDQSPEVALVRQAMIDEGVDFHMDVHGDEALPYNFIAGFEAIEDATEKQITLYNRYLETLDRLSPDFQRTHGYPLSPPGSSDLKKCTDWTAHQFRCPAMTLEMPFKDNADLPNAETGWSPDRCRHLARDCLAALSAIVTEL